MDEARSLLAKMTTRSATRWLTIGSEFFMVFDRVEARQSGRRLVERSAALRAPRLPPL